jgi:Protein of unknown function (DUF1084)
MSGAMLQALLQHTFFKGLLPGILNDLPGLLFFTTYTLLVLFWAEIYHQAKGQTTSRLRPTFLATNIFVYCVQAILVFLSSFDALKAVARVRTLTGILPAAAATLHPCSLIAHTLKTVLYSACANLMSNLLTCWT